MSSFWLGCLLFVLGCVLVLAHPQALLFVGGTALMVAGARHLARWWVGRLRPGTWLVLDARKGLASAPLDAAFWRKFGPQPLLLWEACRALERAAEDERILGALLLVGEKPLALSAVNELGAAIKSFKRTRKPVLGFAESLGEMGSAGMGVTLCALHADHFTLHPGGDLWLGGFALHQPFLRGLFDKLGVVPDFGARRDYKTMRNMFTESGYTPEHREADAAILRGLTDECVRAAALARDVDEGVAKAWFAVGWYAAQAALDAGLVHALGEMADVRFELARRSGVAERKLRRVLCSVNKYALAEKRGGSADAPIVALLTAEGAIQRGSGGGLRPGGNKPVISSGVLVQTLRRLELDDEVKAVVLRIDSPGGSAVASEIIGAAIARLRAAGKPVVASMGRVAASGGYWMAAEADKIVAAPATITGSIGVVSGKFSVRNALERTGLRFGHMKEGTLADLASPLSPWNTEERQAVERVLDITYDRFKSLVAKRRGLSAEEVEAVAQGKVWTGREGRERNLVDVLGGQREAFALACELAGLSAAGTRLVRMDDEGGFIARLRGVGKSLSALRDGIRNAAFVLREAHELLIMLRSAGLSLPSALNARYEIRASLDGPFAELDSRAGNGRGWEE